MRLPPDFPKFLSNGENKERMFELFEDVWIALNDDREIYVARKDKCKKIQSGNVTNLDHLQTNHEEADTKFVYLVEYAQSDRDTVCIVRSSSGDIDIPVIILGSDVDHKRLFIDSGSGKNRKVLDMSKSGLSEQQKKALLGLHSFTGNDYVSSFFRKGKKRCWKLIKDSSEFLQVFGSLGQVNDLTEELFIKLEGFVCVLYGRKRCLSVYKARSEIFREKLNKKNQIVDLSLLPPCRSSLKNMPCERITSLVCGASRSTVPWTLVNQ